MVGMMIIGVVLVVAVAVALWYFKTRSVHGSLASVDIGTVCQFDYEQPLTGEYRRYNVTVLQRDKLDPSWIRAMGRRSSYRKYDRNFKRTPTLVTCITPDGVRQFYAERVTNFRVNRIRTAYNRIRRLCKMK